ncbi:hypothetical protein AMS58_19525 [Pseudoalteromonas porphyrae]|uniref:DUF3630 domain-containing protein n=2 Tax=Pseudoalteromonas TaxID=53246 RepID=A0A0N1EAH3_9GAMM|nr:MULTISPECIES: DUF3630 family protein [Pseudoalteromonas]KPH56862.1 hypothetical protein ADS77_19775 [Pseudoalteromonas porphyrae]KPH93022.1 hypothetical protein AMS58_19525 [Pseudoalteromonas porphyrae]NMR27572.1 DUF3630 family protein [Pseudoalteromonas sp. NEC-BIFX-2020_015]NNG44247.1 DUF3630 family protein [Pseudoalteromonas sp. NEC-BIFX-2020_002]
MTQYQFDNRHNVIIITPSEMPNDDDFELWAHLFLHSSEIKIGEFEAGADRHQMRFNYEQQGFNLNFEHYSNSVWINGEGQEANHLLAALTHYFLTQMQQ